MIPNSRENQGAVTADHRGDGSEKVSTSTRQGHAEHPAPTSRPREDDSSCLASSSRSSGLGAPEQTDDRLQETGAPHTADLRPHRRLNKVWRSSCETLIMYLLLAAE